MQKIALVVHGGAGPDSEFIREHEQEYKQALTKAVNLGYELLEKGEKAIDVVEKVVCFFEDDPLFNAGRGAAMTSLGKYEMCASIMDGKDKSPGAAATIYNLRNPIKLARQVLEHTEHVYLCMDGAMKFAYEKELALEPDMYFYTDHQKEAWDKAREEQGGKEPQENSERPRKKPSHGTVGCVALDKYGNLAAATSTGGTENSKEGRVGDSSMIGVGTYANQDCAVSSTGTGEELIKCVMAHDVAALMEYKFDDVKKAAHYAIHIKNKNNEGDLGVIALDKNANMAMEFNCDRMHRGCKSSVTELFVSVY